MEVGVGVGGAVGEAARVGDGAGVSSGRRVLSAGMPDGAWVAVLSSAPTCSVPPSEALPTVHAPRPRQMIPTKTTIHLGFNFPQHKKKHWIFNPILAHSVSKIIQNAKCAIPQPGWIPRKNKSGYVPVPALEFTLLPVSSAAR